MQLLLSNTGGEISKGKVGEYANAIIEHTNHSILFDNIPSLRTLFGALIIISAGIYIYLREKIKEQLIVSDNPIR